MNTITEQQAFEYEAKRSSILMALIHYWFPKYFIWKVKIRYKRYLGDMEYKRLQIEKRIATEKAHSEIIQKLMFKYN